MRFFVVLFSLFFLVAKSFAQDSSRVVSDSFVQISSIIVSGNKITKTKIVLREMTFKEGDLVKISSLQEAVEISKNQIFNTTLFDQVKVETTPNPTNPKSIIVLVILKERWYIFPMPYFRLVDRNFNDWWITHNKSLERVDYGMKFYHNNFSGNNDRLTIDAITGYTRQFGIRYNLPYFDKALTKGINIGISHVKQKEVNYITSDNNKQKLIKAIEGFPKTFTRIDATYSNRIGLFLRHNYRVAYTWEQIDPFIAFLNPNYFGNAQTTLNYFDVSYNLSYSKTDYNVYPTKGVTYNGGFYARLFAGQNNLFTVGATGMLATKFNDKMYMRNRVALSAKFPLKTGFVNENMFGYGVYQLRGMEYYVVDGVIGAMHKLTLGYNLFNFNLKFPVKNKYIDKIPFKVYGKLYNDVGFSYKENPTSYFNNRIMHGYGAGIDIVTIYDIVFKLEYSMNGVGNSGLFFGLRD